MKAYIANGILIPNEDCAVVYSDHHELEISVPEEVVTIKCELLTRALEMDINLPRGKANVFLHFDHPEFDPTANTELFNSIELEFSYDTGIATDWEDNETGKYCKELYVETKNRNYKMEHLSIKVQEDIISSIDQVVNDYLKEQKFKD